MSAASSPTVLMVPGLRGHMPDHWQTILEGELANATSVPRMEKVQLSCKAWVERLEAALAAIEGPVVLVAHSAGVMMVAHWAGPHRRRIHGALLAAPPDFETPMPLGYPSMRELEKNGWLPTPRRRLPFPSIVAASSNDPLGSLENAQELAKHWGASFANIGDVGHLNPASGYGRWRLAPFFLRTLGVMPG